MNKMIRLFANVLIACVFSSTAVADDAAIAAAVANPDRPAEARERDPSAKPEVILELLAIEKGDSVIDLMGGGGYFTDLIAGVVGPDGRVTLHNNTPYAKFVQKQVQARYIDNPIPGVTYVQSEVDDLKLPPASFDAALMVMSYHDLYYYAPERGWNKTDVGRFFLQVRESLKPGGRLVIVDHRAAEGTGSSSAQTIHRIEESFAKQDIERYGFRFLTSSDALKNPEDDHTKLVFDKSIRGKTDRFILVFEKLPGA